jgi:thioredoxin reductase
MKDLRHFDVIIVGGSYSGLAAGLALGRALRQVLIIDGGKPCNWQTPNRTTSLPRTEKHLRKLQRLPGSKWKCMIQ